MATSSQDSGVPSASPSLKISAFHVGFDAAFLPGLVREPRQQITVIIS